MTVLITTLLLAVLIGLNKISKDTEMDARKQVASYVIAKHGVTIDYYAHKYNLDSAWIAAIICHESQGLNTALGSTPDVGLMQITQPALDDFNNLHDTAFSLGSLFDPELNLAVGCWYIYHIHTNFTNLNWIKTIRAYNAGVGSVNSSDTAGVVYYNHVKTYFDIVNKLRGV